LWNKRAHFYLGLRGVVGLLELVVHLDSDRRDAGAVREGELVDIRPALGHQGIVLRVASQRAAVELLIQPPCHGEKVLDAKDIPERALERTFVMEKEGELFLLTIGGEVLVAEGNLFFASLEVRTGLTKVALEERGLSRNKWISNQDQTRTNLGLVSGALFIPKLLKPALRIHCLDHVGVRSRLAKIGAKGHHWSWRNWLWP